MNITDLRKEYTQGGLLESDAATDPLVQFQLWWNQAITSEIPEPNAMTLATTDRNGRPSARIVLLKGFDARGFMFFTNYESRKGRELQENPFAAVVFFWPELERQVRIEGRVEEVSAEESESYAQSRPRGSQLGAWASEQSRVIGGREELERRLEEIRTRFGEGPIPRPPHWGGYRLIPDLIEFWQGRPSRLHDRLSYRRVDGIWLRERLSP